MSAVLSFARKASPAASEPVLAFIADAKTAQVVSEALPGAVVREDGIGAALGALSQVAAPSTLVVDIGDSDDPAAGIRALAKLGSGRSRIIALGMVNDIALYRALREAGAADYLVKPIVPAALAAAVTSPDDGAARGPAAGKGPVKIFVCGARGGTGATTVAVNIAWHLSRRDGYRVALVDLDLTFGTAALALDIEPSHGLREILENPDRIDSLFVASAAARVGETLSVFAAEEAFDQSAGLPAGIEAALPRLCDALAEGADCIVIDVPRPLAVAHPGLFKLAERAAIVAEMNLAAARDAARLGALINENAAECAVSLIANKCGNRKGDIDNTAFARGARLAIDHFLPLDSKATAAAANAGQALGEAAPSSPLFRALAAAADTLVPPAGSAAGRPFWKRLMLKG
jgi:pilus assembly protein CpaE